MSEILSRSSRRPVLTDYKPLIWTPQTLGIERVDGAEGPHRFRSTRHRACRIVYRRVPTHRVVRRDQLNKELMEISELLR
jgi:hypothetical protein